MIPLTPQLFITAATAYAAAFPGVGEADRRDDMCPPTSPPLDDAATTCLDFIHRAGYVSHYDHRVKRSSWPLPPMNHLAELVAFAAERDVFAARPKAGDIYLLWSPQLKRFESAGVIAFVDDVRCLVNGARAFDCETVGPADGLAQRRRLSLANGDRFIRWTALEYGNAGEAA